ncbi:MAG: arylamine N-acetyltransferase family protein [Eubacteriales bacterium]|jgi:arylamine N-acetyltransferase
MFDIDAYLRRIGISERPAEPSYRTLAMLQYAHLTHVPYETMDIVRRVPFSIASDAVYEKVVVRGRGGYCFELNGLFTRLLRELGYPVTEYFGRFLRDADPGIPMRRHRVLRVTASDGCDYICDVGVGGVCPLTPLPFVPHTVTSEQNGTWRIETYPFYGYVVEEYKRGEWRQYYCFTLDPCADIDYEAADWYCQTSPHSFFRDRPIVALQTETGRRTLSGDMFRVFDGERVEEICVTDTETRDRLLKERFGIVF